MQLTAQAYRLQDGTLCNPQRRLKKHAPTLMVALAQVKDGRSAQGKRHSLESILTLLLCGLTANCKNVQECWEWASKRSNQQFLIHITALTHGIPHPTTISRALQVGDPSSLLSAITLWYRLVFGVVIPDEAVSLDGKTLRGVHGKGVVRHIFSLVTHTTQRLLGQIGVTTKENEITACPRLLAQAKIDLPDLVVTADALLTQKDIATDIRSKGAHYLLTVKGNQLELKDILVAGFSDPCLQKHIHRYSDYTHGRQMTITVEISQDFDLKDLRLDWKDLAWVGRVTRVGLRPYQKPGHTHVGLKPFHEQIYFICSVEELTAEAAAILIRGHWGIENQLHWQKDWSFLEDRQRLRKGMAPQVMTLLRSVALNLLRELGITEISRTLRAHLLQPRLHRAFLYQTGIIN